MMLGVWSTSDSFYSAGVIADTLKIEHMSADARAANRKNRKKDQNGTQSETTPATVPGA